MSAASIQDLNRQLARRINEEARSNPQSPYANKFVGIANGQVVVVADDADQMSRQLRQIEPDPSKCFFVEASRDYDEVHEIVVLLEPIDRKAAVASPLPFPADNLYQTDWAFREMQEAIAENRGHEG
jgi:hypothetical protein